MLFALKYPLFIFLIFSFVMGLAPSVRTETGTPAFQESLTWARDQAAKIKDQIAGVDTSFSGVQSPEKNERGEKGQDDENDQRQEAKNQAKWPHSQEESPACRPTFGKLSPCGEKPKDEKKLKAQARDKVELQDQDKPEPDVKEAIVSSSNKPLPGKTLIFISLSMPEASLKSLVQEADRHQAVLVLRGLVNDSFKETAETFQRLGLSAEINPEAFERHHINQVPTFVWVDENDQERGRLKGNVTLIFVQQKFREVSL